MTQTKVLLISASRIPSVRERVDREFVKIIEKVKKSRFSSYFDFPQVVQATRFEDFQTALLEHEPHVLHISSQGEEDGSLRFQLGEDGSHVASKKKLLRLLKALRDNIRIVVVNAGHSHALARDIPPNIDLAIGMNTTLPDDTAIEFSAAFYETLGYGRSVAKAFAVACSHFDNDEQIPQIFASKDEDLDLVLVTPI
jgi:hypothetical protein